MDYSERTICHVTRLLNDDSECGCDVLWISIVLIEIQKYKFCI